MIQQDNRLWTLVYFEYLDPFARQNNPRCKWCFEQSKSNTLADMRHCSLCPRLDTQDWQQQPDGWLVHREWQTRVAIECEAQHQANRGNIATDLAWLHSLGYIVVIDTIQQGDSWYPRFTVLHNNDVFLQVYHPDYMRSNIQHMLDHPEKHIRRKTNQTLFDME